MSLEKEFVLYPEALALKQLGFDEPCICGYSKNTEQLETYSRFLVTKDSFTVDAPTYSQAFRFFREKFKLHSYIEGAYPWFRYYINSHDNIWEGFKYLRHEEAELACLRKLIEIVKKEQ